jgi:hypothetical protein
VHVDAVGAPVELRRADPEEFAQRVVDVDAVELLGGRVVEVGHGPRERRRVCVEVEPGLDLGRGCHGDHAMRQPAHC